MAGQHPAKWKPLLRGQPHHRAVGPHRGALLLQVSQPNPYTPSPLIAHFCSASLPIRSPMKGSADKAQCPLDCSTSDSADRLAGALSI